MRINPPTASAIRQAVVAIIPTFLMRFAGLFWEGTIKDAVRTAWRFISWRGRRRRRPRGQAVRKRSVIWGKNQILDS